MAASRSEALLVDTSVSFGGAACCWQRLVRGLCPLMAVSRSEASPVDACVSFGGSFSLMAASRSEGSPRRWQRSEALPIASCFLVH